MLGVVPPDALPDAPETIPVPSLPPPLLYTQNTACQCEDQPAYS